MELKKRIDIAKKLFVTSPLREKIKNNLILPININESEECVFDEIMESLSILEKKLIKPLNIVLMGEVKAGKSTLLNTLVEDEISPTDIFEATAVILEVGYGQEEKAVIYYKDGNKEEGKIEDIFNILNSQQKDIEFSGKIEKVKIQKNKESYRYYNLVDTPGLLTITSVNEETTQNYIEWADVILWILDCNYLGQTDIKEEIEKVEEYGKPIIGILNKIDIVEDEEDKVIEYAEDMYELYFEKIIPLSAKKAFDGVISNNQALIEESKLNNLIDYLSENIIKSEEVSKEVQTDSIKRTLLRIIEKELYYHINMKNKAEEILKTYQDIKENVEYHKERINNQIRDIVKSEVTTNFLRSESEHLLSKIDSISVLNVKIVTGEIESFIQSLDEEESAKTFLLHLQTRIGNISREEWKKAWDIIELKIKEKIKIIIEKEKRTRELLQDNYYNNNGNTNGYKQYQDFNKRIYENILFGADIKELKEALIYSGGIGVAMATYIATIGPAAASITIGTALGAVIPPALIGGLIVAGIKTMLSIDETKEALKSQLLSRINETRQKFNNEIVDKYILPKVYESNEEFKEKILDSYTKVVFNNYDIYDVKRFINEIDQYIKKVEKILYQEDKI